MTPTPDREAELFNATRKLPPDQRAAFLDRACAGEDRLRRQVEELLRASEAVEAFLPEDRQSTDREPAAALTLRVGCPPSASPSRTSAPPSTVTSSWSGLAKADAAWFTSPNSPNRSAAASPSK